MTWGYNCKLFDVPIAMGAKGYSDLGTIIKHFRFAIRTTKGELIFALGPNEYNDKSKKYMDSWNRNQLSSTFGIPSIYPELNPYWGKVYIQNIDESVLDNAYIEVSWFSVIEIKEYYAKIILTKSDIEILKDLAINNGWNFFSILTGAKVDPHTHKEVSFIIRLSVGGIGYIVAARSLGDEFLLKPILGVAMDDQKQISRMQKLNQLKDLDYAQFFQDKYQDPDFLKTFKKAVEIAKESKRDISKCYPFNNYGSIITSIRKSTNFYKYKLNINKKYKVAFMTIYTTAQEQINLVGKEIYEKTLIAAPIIGFLAVLEVPDDKGKKIWTKMRFRFLPDYIHSCSSPNKEDKIDYIEYFKYIDELSGYPEIIGNKITVDQNGLNSTLDRENYNKLNLITYSFVFDFENNRMQLLMRNDQKALPCPFYEAFVIEKFFHDPSKPIENANNRPIFPRGTELE